MKPIRLAVLTVSDAASRQERTDTSGDAIRSWSAQRGSVLVERAVVPDDGPRIREQLEAMADGGAVDLIVTTGGTGFTDRDVTPEATRAALEREAPGVADALRSAGAASTPMAWLSRGVAGIRGRTVIVNLPGSTTGVRDGLAVLDSFIDHAVQLVRGDDTRTHPDHG